MTRTISNLALVAATLAGCSSSETTSLDLPLDPSTGLRIAALPPLPSLPEWDDNPATPEKKTLGQLLFFDGRLSGSGNTQCGTCHASLFDFHSAAIVDAPDRSFPSGTPLHRHTPSLQNIIYAPMMRWDGSHFTDLYDMMVLPFAEANMNLSRLPPEAGEDVDIPGAQAALHRKLTQEIAGYVPLFREAFGVDIEEQTEAELWRLAGKAIAVYLRVATTHGAPFDAWNAGDDDAISDAAKRGAALFAGDAGCVYCHSGPLLSDFQFHNISTELPDADGHRHDEGRFLVSGREEDRGAFLTPMLRGVSQTSPYLHHGESDSLQSVIRHLSDGRATEDPLHSPIAELVPELTDGEIEDLVAFLKALTGSPRNQADIDVPANFPQ